MLMRESLTDSSASFTRLRAVRLALAVSQAELARRIGVDPSLVCRVELGQSRPYPRFRRAAAEALGVAESALFGDRP